jgi:hypothetical protein
VSLLVFTTVFTSNANANVADAGVKAETVAAWSEYVARVEARRDNEVVDANSFRLADRARLGRGEVIVENVPGRTIDIEGGTISHWRGAVFVSGATLEQLLEAARFEGNRVRHPQDVIAARVLSRNGDSLRLFLKLRREAIVTVAYNTEHDVHFERVGPSSAVSRSVSTRIAELRDVGSPAEREKPSHEDRGFMRRVHSYWRYQAVPGGVIVELESLTLSRDLSWAVRTIAGPIINKIARDSVTRTLAVLR